MEKRCTKCREIKDFEDFQNDKKARDGKKSRCKECIRKGRPSRKKKYKGLVKVPGNKILCKRNGKLILKKRCVPGCNDACITCEHKQIDNVSASSDTFSPEHEATMRHEGAYRSSSAIAIEDGYIDREGI